MKKRIMTRYIEKWISNLFLGPMFGSDGICWSHEPISVALSISPVCLIRRSFLTDDLYIK